MRKIVYLILILLLSEGCSGVKRLTSGRNREYGEAARSIGIDDIIKQNFTSGNFNIDKAVIRFRTENESENLIANIKFRSPDKYLLSLRSKIGVEIARIYLDADTVLVNDRINRKLLYGKPEDLKRKFGMSGDLIPLLLGDLIMGKTSQENVSFECNRGYADIKTNIEGMEVGYNADCRKLKVNSAVVRNKTGEEILRIECRKFTNDREIIHSSEIIIDEILNGIEINLRIEKFSGAGNEEIEFIPGNRYEMIELK